MAALNKTQLHLGHLLIIVVLSSAGFMRGRRMGINESCNFSYRKGKVIPFPLKRI